MNISDYYLLKIGVIKPMKTIVLRNPMYFVLEDKDKETPTGVSMTVPDQSISLAELLRRHIAGTAPAVSQNPLYEENADFDSADYTKINTLDLSEKAEIREALTDKIHHLKESLKPKPKPAPEKSDQPRADDEPAKRITKKGSEKNGPDGEG